jgi:hypothetical protein
MKRRGLSFGGAFTLALLAAGSAFAQPQPAKRQPAKPKASPKKPSLTLPVLEKKRNESMRVYIQGEVELKGIAQGEVKLVAELSAARELARLAEKGTPGPLTTKAVQAARAETRRVSNRLARLRMRSDELSTRQELNRMRQVEARSAFASRLLLVAHRTLLRSRRDPSGRGPRQAQAQIRVAVQELHDISELRALEPAPAQPPSIQPLDPDATLEEMDWRKGAYERQLGAFGEQLVNLRPKELRRKRHVKRLNDMIEGGYAVPRLRQTLVKEQVALERVLVLRRRIEGHKAYYHKAVKALRLRIKERMR